MTIEFDAPLVVPDFPVRPDWIDYNGHMNVAYYVAAFDLAVDYFLHAIDLGENAAQTRGSSSFTLEIHVNYIREVHEADPLRITCQLLGYDKKRFHYFLQMYHATENFLSATSEQIGIHVDLNTRKTATMPEQTLQRLAAMHDAHGGLEVPKQVGSVIGIRRRTST